jgi:sugar/nucleoside kinase (ribokinase family)
MRGDSDGPFSRLLHVGNVVVDLVVSVPAVPERGGDVLASATHLTAGGGFNVMAAAVRQGLPAAYAGAHGTGPFAAMARAALAAEGIEVLLAPKPDADTGIVVAMVEADGERTFLTSPGAEASLTAGDLATVRAAPGDVVYLSGYGLAHPVNRAALLPWLGTLPGQTVVVFDPGPLVGTIPADALAAVLARVGWLTCNAAEAARLAEAPATGGDIRPAGDVARALMRRAPQARVLVRLGAAGCLLGEPGTEPVHVPGIEVTAVDANGAGDTHTGALLAALARGEAAVPAVRHANAAAAWSVSRRGPATGPTRQELAEFLAGATPAGGPGGGVPRPPR